MREASLHLVNADPTLRILVIGPYAFLEPIRERTGLIGKDGHAGSIETSEMLVVAEDRVHSTACAGDAAAALPIPGIRASRG